MDGLQTVGASIYLGFQISVKCMYIAIKFELEVKRISEKHVNEVESSTDPKLLQAIQKTLVSKQTLKRDEFCRGYDLYSVKDVEQTLNMKMVYNGIKSKDKTLNSIGKNYI